MRDNKKQEWKFSKELMYFANNFDFLLPPFFFQLRLSFLRQTKCNEETIKVILETILLLLFLSSWNDSFVIDLGSHCFSGDISFGVLKCIFVNLPSTKNIN